MEDVSAEFILKMAGGVFILLVSIVSWFIKVMHKQAMDKFDMLINKVDHYGKTAVIHEQRLKSGDESFKEINVELEKVKLKSQQNSDRILKIEIKKAMNDEEK